MGTERRAVHGCGVGALRYSAAVRFALVVIIGLLCLSQAAVSGTDLAGLYETTAGHYQVLTERGGELGPLVNGFMNEMLRHYSRWFANFTPKAGARVIVFADAERFRAYARSGVGLIHAELTGYCHLKTDAEGNTFYELVTYESPGLWRTLAHEGFHQFLGYELGLEVPIWLNEGLAQYFETTEWRQGRLHPGLISGRKLAAAQSWLRNRRAPAVGELIRMDRARFYENASVAYPVSWALVYYLVNRDGATFRTGGFRRYLDDLKLGRDPVGSFHNRFGRDTELWQRDFERFIFQLRPHVQ